MTSNMQNLGYSSGPQILYASRRTPCGNFDHPISANDRVTFSLAGPVPEVSAYLIVVVA
jgi:hypothetical protein